MDIIGFMLEAIGIILLACILLFLVMLVSVAVVIAIDELIHMIKKKGGKK